jgi:hypothetical protein
VQVSAQDQKDQHLESVGGLSAKSVRKVSEGVREIKLRRDSSLCILWEQAWVRFEPRESLGAEGILKEENRQAGFAGRILRSPADRWIWEKLRGKLTLKRRKDPSHRISAFGF